MTPTPHVSVQQQLGEVRRSIDAALELLPDGAVGKGGRAGAAARHLHAARSHLRSVDLAVAPDPAREYLLVRYDVTDLTEAERDRLALEAVVQGESSDADEWQPGHPDVDADVVEVTTDVGMCCNHECRRFEYRVVVVGDPELSTCDECTWRLVHESGLTWKDAAAAGYRRDTSTERGTTVPPNDLASKLAEVQRFAADVNDAVEAGDLEQLERVTRTAGEQRAESDAALLTEETDASLRAMIDAPVGSVSETTRELARLELESRGCRCNYAGHGLHSEGCPLAEATS